MKDRGLSHFIRRTLLGAIPAILVVGATVYYWFSVRPNLAGDLGQLGKIPFSHQYGDTLRAPHIPGNMVRAYSEGEQAASIVTVGDSFSQMELIGYQNYLGHLRGDTICNIWFDPDKGIIPEQGLSNLINSGFFEEHPEIETVIIEGIERDFLTRWTMVDFGQNPQNMNIVRAADRQSREEGSDRSYQNILSAIFRQGSDWVRLVLKLDKSPVVSARMTRPMFTEPGHESDLYFYRYDLKPYDIDPGQMEAITRNIKEMEKRLNEKGVRMICFAVPDKFELYRPYLEKDNFKPRAVGERLSELDSLGIIFFPLGDLRGMTDRGEKDLYMADDTHWSYKASERVAELLNQKINQKAD